MFTEGGATVTLSTLQQPSDCLPSTWDTYQREGDFPCDAPVSLPTEQAYLIIEQISQVSLAKPLTISQHLRYKGTH